MSQHEKYEAVATCLRCPRTDIYVTKRVVNDHFRYADIFDEIFINFKNKVRVKIPEVIDVREKYFHAEYQFLFLRPMVFDSTLM